MAIIALGADHAGFELKRTLGAWLADRGHIVLDFGTDSTESVDYPDFAATVASAVATGRAERGLLVCGSGVGMAIAANKVAGVRAATAVDLPTARLSREHNDTNVLALGARVLDDTAARSSVEAWLAAVFAGGRHARRLEKITALENIPRESAHATR